MHDSSWMTRRSVYSNRPAGIVCSLLLLSSFANGQLWGRQSSSINSVRKLFRWPLHAGMNYEPLKQVSFPFNTTSDYCLEMEIESLQMEANSNCLDGDYVSIHDGTSTKHKTLGIYCGSPRTPIKLKSSGSNMMLSFYSDEDYITGQGIQGYVRPVACTPVFGSATVNAGGNDNNYQPPALPPVAPIIPNNNNGVEFLAQIQYPLPESGQYQYSPSSDYWWRYYADVGSCLEFKITSIMMEFSYNCVNDYVTVFNGNYENRHLIQRVCGNSIPSAVRSTANEIYIFFHSDQNYQTGSGFTAIISTIRNCMNPRPTLPPPPPPPPQTPPPIILIPVATPAITIRPARTTKPPTPITPSSHSIACGYPDAEPIETGLYFGTADNDKEAGRVVGGHPANPHSWPWQVTIRYSFMHWCGGTLVSRRHIVSDPNDYEIWAGKHKKDSREPGTEQQLYPEAIITHQNYQVQTKWDSDIVVIRLREPGAVFNKYVRPACLPSSPMHEPPLKSACYVSGWGETKGTGDDLVLKQAAVPIVNVSDCANMDRTLKDLLTERMICAGYEQGGHDACQGDSGGPLVCKIGEQADSWVLSGVVSFGNGCAQKNSPGVYVRVTKFLQFLKAKITDLPKSSRN